MPPAGFSCLARSLGNYLRKILATPSYIVKIMSGPVPGLSANGVGFRIRWFNRKETWDWIPAFAGMTGSRGSNHLNWNAIQPMARSSGNKAACDIILSPSTFIIGTLRRLPTAVLARHSITIDSLAAGLDDGQSRVVNAVQHLAYQMGVSVFLVGGPVRDALLGVPVLDLDFSVEGDAVAFARELSDMLGGRVRAHKRFGTATVSLCGETGSQSESRVDFVTARRERYVAWGQLPEVEPATIVEDLARRDFSINSMALGVFPRNDELLDFHGGLNDLMAGSVRVLHPGSFLDDPTRILRAIRYEQRFGFSLQSDSLALLSEAVSKGCVDAVSGDRWRHEIERIALEDDPAASLLRASELRVLEAISPPLRKLRIDASKLQRLISAENPNGRTGLTVVWAAIFGQLRREEGEALIERLRLSGRWATIARDTIGLSDVEPLICADCLRPSELFELLSGFHSDAIAAWSALASHPAVVEASRRYMTELRYVKPQLSSADLLEMGVPQGPLLGKMLAELLAARFDGDIGSLEEEQTAAKKMLAEHCARPPQ